MKWCVFVNRRCNRNDCVGWVKDNCFIYSLLPIDYSNKQLQTEFDWSNYEFLKTSEHNLMKNSDEQSSFLDELERLITQNNISKQ
jgi:hypothetical protein